MRGKATPTKNFPHSHSYVNRPKSNPFSVMRQNILPSAADLVAKT